jgi:site-specific recombinase XerD
VSALRTFTRYLRREGFIDADPAVLAGGAKARAERCPRISASTRWRRLLETPDVSTPLGRRDRAILELFYASGIRLSELVALDLEDVDLSGSDGARHGQGPQGTHRSVQHVNRRRACASGTRIERLIAERATPQCGNVRERQSLCS